MNRTTCSILSALVASVALVPAVALADVNTLPIGLIGYTHSVGWNPVGIDVAASTVYLADFSSGGRGILQTYGVADPTEPALLGSQWASQEIGDLAVSAPYVFTANDANGLAVYDASDPASFALVAQRRDGTYAHSISLASAGPSGALHAFVGHIYGGQLEIYDVSNPLSLPAPTAYTSPTPGTRDVYDTQVAGSLAYVLVGDGIGNMRVEVLDIGSLPAPPTRIGQVAVPINLFGDVGELRVSGNHVFWSASNAPGRHEGGLRVIDVSDPTSPAVVASLDITDVGTIPWKGAGLDVAGDRAYVVGRSALHVIDISDPLLPTEVASHWLPTDFAPGLSGHVVVDGILAYVSAYSDLGLGGRGGLAVFKIAQPVLDVRFDVVPGSPTRCLRARESGVLPVFIYGSDSVRAADIDVASLRLGAMQVRWSEREDRYLAHLEDANGDGYEDLAAQFEVTPGSLVPGTTELTLTGSLTTGPSIKGSDAICIRLASPINPGGRTS